MNRHIATVALCASMLVLGATALRAETRGVTKDEILIGVPIDLSGPLAEVGRQGQKGAQMAEEEINAKGGINGRKLKILYEDQQYDAKKTVLVTQKLIEQDKVFAIMLTYGTGPAAAAYPMVLKSGTPHVCPSTASAMFAEPMEKLSFQCYPSYGAMSASGIKNFLDKQAKKKVCLIYQDDEFGAEVKSSMEKVLATAGQKIVEEAGYKRGATDFSAQVARVQRGECDLLMLAAVPPAAAAIMQDMQRRSWAPTVLIAPPGFEDNTIKLGKDAVEGAYAVGFIAPPDLERSPADEVDWMKRYQAKYSQPASLYAAYAYMFVYLAAEGIKNAGPDLTVDSLVKGMENVKNYKSIFGATFTFSDKSHAGVTGAKLFQVKGQRWVETGDLPPAM
jgi:branched-chain amino acid transport system substrate-binding protein